MKLLGNYNEYIRPSKLKIGNVYIFSELGDAGYISASIYLGITDKNEYCFYVIEYLNVFISKNNVYLLNNKEIELLPSILKLVMGTRISKNNIIKYVSIQGRILKELDLSYDIINWKMKQLLLNKEAVPNLLEKVKKKSLYITKSNLKENTFYFNTSMLYYYIGKNNGGKYHFKILNFYTFNDILVKMRLNKVNSLEFFKKECCNKGKDLYETKLPSLYDLSNVSNVSSLQQNYVVILLKELSNLV